MSFKALHQAYGADKDLETKGVWVYPPVDEDQEPVGFLLARMSRSNRKWANRMNRIYRENKRRIDQGALTDDATLKETMKAFCETIVLDWKMRDGSTIISYTPEECFKLLDGLPDLYDYLAEKAGLNTNYQHRDMDDVAGKSATISSGS